MPPGDGVQAGFQRGDVERAAQRHGEGDVVGRLSGFQLLVEPQPLLGEGKRRRPGIRAARDSRRACFQLSAQAFFEQRALGR